MAKVDRRMATPSADGDVMVRWPGRVEQGSAREAGFANTGGTGPTWPG